jgi:hypothetical protein
MHKKWTRKKQHRSRRPIVFETWFLVAFADFTIPLIADLLLDAATSTSEKSCFLCFSVKQIWHNKQVHVLQ